jgi:hypothetical protein
LWKSIMGSFGSGASQNARSSEAMEAMERELGEERKKERKKKGGVGRTSIPCRALASLAPYCERRAPRRVAPSCPRGATLGPS